MRKSVLSPELKGVIFITGQRGIGKTYLAAHIDWPEHIAFFDFDEGKGEGTSIQLGFGYYKPVEEDNPLKRADMFMAEIERLEAGRYTTVIIDNILPLEKALQAMVYRDAAKWAKVYGYETISVLRDSFGKARGIVNDMTGDAIAKKLHAKGVKAVVIISHIKQKWDTPGKMVIEGRDRWQQLSILTLILGYGEQGSIPSALVYKEALGKITPNIDDLTEEQHQAIMRGEAASHTIIRRLPYRIPICDWQHIRWYLNNPANLVDPAEGEKIKLEESEPFSERLSSEQIAYQLRSIEREAQAEREAEEAASLLQAQAEEAVKNFVASLDGDLTPTKLAKVKAAIESGELNWTGEVTPALIRKWSE